MITQNELKKSLNYNEETGIFTWLVSAGTRAKGSIAGSLDKQSGYIKLNIKGNPYQAHRLAWLYITGCFPKNLIDHINGITFDNSFLNLREATHSENLRNMGIRKSNKSGFKGVSWCNTRKKWVAEVKFNGSRKHLGYFDDAKLASESYEKFARENYGEFYVPCTTRIVSKVDK